MSNEGFRNLISSDSSAEFPAVPGRYHLYISYGCPWASRCYAVLKLKGLEHAISYTMAKSKWERTREGEAHLGWVFPSSLEEEPGAEPDPLYGAKSLRELYELAVPGYAGKFSTPVFWDKEKKTIVNNETSDIVKMLNNEFNHVAKHPDCDLFPPHLLGNIEEVNSWTNDSITNGVYRGGLARQQQPYEQAAKAVFEALDKCEELLGKQRYICGNVLTEPDIRLFVTFIRFDEVYSVYFKLNKRLLREYPNLFNYTKDIYQIPGMSNTVNMYHIKKFYYCSHPNNNPSGVIPVGPDIDYSTPHNRERLK